jgi:shikimate dehydrogenase
MSVTARTTLIGLLGWPVYHSLSPAMHNAAFRALGMDWAYLPLAVTPERLPDALAGLKALGFRGANVTIPHKEHVLLGLDEVAPEARSLGAVNTLVVEEGRLVGHNTDVAGFLTALDKAACTPDRAVVLGAGGAARAAVHALLSRGVTVTVANRSPQRAQRLVCDFGAPSWRASSCSLETLALRDALDRAGLLVNATPAGMWPDVDATPLPPGSALHAGLAVMDLVYNPLETLLLRQARQAGAKCINGLDMLVYQGAAAFRLWTGQEAPVAIMRQAAVAALERRSRP